MDTATTLAETFAAVAYADSYPTVTEYANAAPVDRRAILARWKQLHDHQVMSRALGWRGFARIYPLTHEDAMAQFEKHQAAKRGLKSRELIENYRRAGMSEAEREADDFRRDDMRVWPNQDVWPES